MYTTDCFPYVRTLRLPQYLKKNHVSYKIWIEYTELIHDKHWNDRIYFLKRLLSIFIKTMWIYQKSGMPLFNRIRYLKPARPISSIWLDVTRSSKFNLPQGPEPGWDEASTCKYLDQINCDALHTLLCCYLDRVISSFKNTWIIRSRIQFE